MFDDICNHIDNEMKNIGTSDAKLAKKVREYLTVDREIFNTNYYQ